MKKNILIYIPTGLNTPELEILISKAQDEINNKNNIIILLCRGGGYYSCPKNIFSLNSICVACKDRRKRGIDKLKGKFKLIYTPKITNNTKVSSDYFTFTKTYNYKFRGIDNGLAAYGAYAELTKDRDLDGFISGRTIKKLINTSNNLTVYFEEVIKKEKIDEIYLFNGRNNNYRPLLRLGKKHKIKTHNLEFNGDRNQVFDNESFLPFDTKYITKKINYFWKNNRNKKLNLINKYSKIWIKDQSIIHKDKFKVFQKPNLLPATWNNKKKNIVFFCNSDDESVTGGKDYFFKISKDQYEIIKIVYDIIKKKDNFKNIDLWIRMHPRMTGLKWPSLSRILDLKKEIKNLNLIEPKSKISSYEMLKKSDLIMAPISSLTIEAVNYGIPAINFQAQPFTVLNGAYLPETKKELAKLIFKNNLKPKSILAAKKHILYFLDGGVRYKRIKGSFKKSGYLYNNEKISLSLFGKFFYYKGKILERIFNILFNFRLYKFFK